MANHTDRAAFINMETTKESFRWQMRKKGRHVLNICTKWLLLTGVAASIAFAPTFALANPAGGTVVSGAADIVNTSATQLDIHQHTNRAVINWDSFDIPEGSTTQFHQPGTSSIALNRISTSGQLTAINGNLIANGQVIIVNPNGVVFGKTANIDTAALTASTADMTNAAFMGATNVFDFNIAGKSGASIVNDGTITVADTGLVTMVAPSVKNNGLIQARMGKVTLAAADTFGVDLYGDGLLYLAVGESKSLESANSGSIIADSGSVVMTAAAASDVVDSVINHSGYIQAQSLVKGKNGEVILTAQNTKVTVSGKIDVSGADSAGTVKIGGDRQGEGSLFRAAEAYVTETAEIKADTTNNGDGGTIIVWSDLYTETRGAFYARGGATGGNGGFVETSSAGVLDVDGTTVNTLAAAGQAGYWLLDPAIINVKPTGDNYVPATHNNTATGGTSDVNVASINNASSNVVLAASDKVTINADIDMVNTGVGLIINAGTGGINMSGDKIRTDNGNVTFFTTGGIDIANSTIYTRGGAVNFTADTIKMNNSSAIGTGGGNVTMNATSEVALNSTNINTSGGTGPGGISLTENGAAKSFFDVFQRANSFFETGGNAGTISITSKKIGKNSTCFSAGGTSCAVADPFTPSVYDITVAADAKWKIYGDADPLYTYQLTVGTLQAGDGWTGSLLRVAGEDVGTYQINQGDLAVLLGGGATHSYNLTYIPALLTINPYVLAVIATNKTKTYGDSDAPLTYTHGGLVNGDTDAVFTGSLLRAGGETVGNYAINQGSLSAGSNYTISYTAGNYAITPAALTVTANNGSKTYGDVYGFSDGFATSGLKFSDTVTGVDLASSGAVATANIGGYAITASNATGTGLGNYTISYVDGVLTVSPAALTVTANNGSKTYGDIMTFAGTEFTASGLKNTDTVTTVNLTSGGTIGLATIGNYKIFASGAAGTGLSNYTISYVNGTLTVTPAALTVKANNGSKTYGDVYGFGDGYTVTGLKNLDTVTSVDLASSGAVATANAGNYAIVPSNAGGSGLSNYNITYVNGNLRVNRASLVVTADDLSKEYGDWYSFNGTEFTVSGLKNSDTVGSVNLLSLGQLPIVPVGDYTILAFGANGTGLSNYRIRYRTGTLSVTPAPLTITALDASKDYGDVHVFGPDYTVAGLKNFDMVWTVDLASLGAPAPAAPGAYDITAAKASGFGLGNYSISYVNGTLTVTAPPAFAPTVQFDPLGRPIVSYANNTLVLDLPFEQIETKVLTTDVNIANSNRPMTAIQLASIEPAAGDEDDMDAAAKKLAGIETAAGGDGDTGYANDDIGCANTFLEGGNCNIE